MTETRKRGEIVSDFTDIGTGERFAKGDTPLIDPGAYSNYEAAGLVQAPPTTTATPAARKAPAKRKSASKAAAKPAAKAAAATTTSAETATAPAKGEADASA